MCTSCHRYLNLSVFLLWKRCVPECLQLISKQSGVAEVLKHALKVDFWDVDALADAIYGLLKYPALSRMAGRCGLEEVNTLKWENAAYLLKHIYEEVKQN